MCAPNTPRPTADTRGPRAPRANASTRSGGDVGRRRVGPRRPPALAHVGVERELGDDERPRRRRRRARGSSCPSASANSRRFADLLGHRARPRPSASCRADPDQQEVAAPDRRDRVAVDGHGRARAPAGGRPASLSSGTTRYASNTPSTRLTAASTLDRCAMSASSNVNRSRVMRSRPVAEVRRQDVHVAVRQHRGHVGEQARAVERLDLDRDVNDVGLPSAQVTSISRSGSRSQRLHVRAVGAVHATRPGRA